MEQSGITTPQPNKIDNLESKRLVGCQGELNLLIIEYLEETADVYDITVPDTSNFYANDILVHNCTEILSTTKPLKHIFDEEGEISLCTLAAINWGVIKIEDFEKVCRLIVNFLDSLLSYQEYPIAAARVNTMNRRQLGVGIINFAYWMAKNGFTYDNVSDEALAEIHRWAEAWSYHMIKASNDLAIERGACPKSDETKYSLGQVPIDTYKKDVDDLVPPVYYMPWDELRANLKIHKVRNSTLMAGMPSETSSQISNSTNGIEPVRALVSVKQSKDGVSKQVVPEIRKYKNKYDLLWEMKSPVGYLKIMAVLTKFIDQAISINTSYNPQNYEGGEIPMSELLNHLILCYKWGLPTAYYFNTYDGAGEIEMEAVVEEAPEVADDYDEPCDSCVL